DLLYLQAGIVYRSVVKFDIGFIPKGSTIHLAELLMERDPLTSKLNRFSGDAAFSAHAMVVDSATGAFESSAATGTLKSGTDQTYTADVHTTVQSWVRGPNYGLMLRVTGEQEFMSFDLLTFYGPTAADAALRPRIRILYSTPQN
ncbi:MAG TPA: DNRLRE domain-containing protein, partial [Bacteroidota bacterium]|nr:DNRLRE domain-containing protein [Bacteroidota bacterium]